MRKLFLYYCLAAGITGGVQAQTAQKPTAVKNAAAINTSAKPGNSMLSGTLAAPAGSSFVIQCNGKNDLALTAKKEAGQAYNTSAFNLSVSGTEGTKINITLAKKPQGQTCLVYAGSEGSLPQNGNLVRIGADYTYDLVTRSSDDRAFSTHYENYDLAVGGDKGEEGRYVTFVSAAANFAGSTGKHRQVFWRDRNTGVTKLVSADAAGIEGNGDSYAPAISGDGKTVAFESYSSNLVKDDKNGFRDVFIWNSGTNTIERISIGKDGREADAESYGASVSGDGNLVAFTSAAGNISPTAKGVSTNNVFLRDIKQNTTIMLSIDFRTGQGGGGSNPSISYDGNRVAFYSHTGTLVAGDTNGIWDIFLWEKNSSKLKRISLTTDGKERNQGNESANRIVAPALSGDGRFIAYSTTATNMAPGVTNGFQQVFVYDVTTEKTVLTSSDKSGKPGNGDSPIGQGEKIAISFDGRWLAFSTNATNLGVPAANVVMNDRQTGENRAISTVTGSSVGRPVISQTAGYVVFSIGSKLDSRFASSGIFANYTGVGLCRACPQ